MTKRRSTLTGRWSGAYRYPGDAFPETVFEAHIDEDADGGITGIVREPDIARDPSVVLDAGIQGTREGAELTFLKFYDDGFHQIITYDGKVDSALEHIEGAWNIPDDWSGTFFMTRERDEEDGK